MKNILKYHKAISAAAVVLIPSLAPIIEALKDSGVDWSVLATLLGMGGWQTWAFAAVAVFYLYTKNHDDKTDKVQLKTDVAQLMKLVEELAKK